MGFNQHTRGVWCNNLVYNIHLLTGKISEPGNSPFSLTGQPSACGTAREVGTFSHRLPADMVVDQQGASRHRRADLEAARGHHPRQARLSRGAAEPHAEGRPAQRLLGAGQQQPAGRRRTPTRRPIRATATRTTSSSSPTPIRPVTALAADLILPTAMWVEKEGAYGNAERRTQFWHQLVTAPGEARSDLWQLMEFSKRFKIEEVWPEELIAKKPEYRGKTLFDVLFTQRPGRQVSGLRHRGRLRQRRVQGVRLLRAEGPVRGICRASAAATATTSRRSTPITRCAACAGRWSTARRRAGASARASTPM